MNQRPEPTSAAAEQSFSFEDVGLDSAGIAGRLAHLFAGHVEHTFIRLGVPDAKLHDYITDLMIRATDPALVVDAHEKYMLNPTSTSKKANPFEVYQRMIPHLEGRALRSLLKEMGDCALYTMGAMGRPAWADASVETHSFKLELSTTGQQAFRDGVAVPLSDSDAKVFHDENDAILKVADRFELCAYALREIQNSITEEAKETQKHGSNLLFY